MWYNMVGDKMLKYLKHRRLLHAIATFASIYLLVYGTLPLFVLCYALIAIMMITRAVFINGRDRLKLALSAIYLSFLGLQIYYAWYEYEGLVPKLIQVLLLFVPVYFERAFRMSIHTKLYLPSAEVTNTITLTTIIGMIHSKFQGTKELHKTLNVSTLGEIAIDLSKHNSLRYINNGSLTEEYFEEARQTLNDPYVYIVISNTGSSASDLISVFTKKQFNHASLSFDQDLKTIISYNGGEKVYPPGLNKEFLSFFNKRKGASIIVYKLKCTKEQKHKMIEKVYSINQEGSAYNILGLVLKNSYKPNIMFCSQFVYSMLKYADLDYFNEKAELVKPTDLVELDYYRSLEFVEEIIFT